MNVLASLVPALLLTLAPVLGAAQATPEPELRLASVAERGPAGPTDLLATPAHLEVEGVRLSEALTRLQDDSGVRIAYSPTLLPSERTVTCECADATVGEAVARLIRGTAFESAVAAGQVVIRPTSEPKIRLASATPDVAWDGPPERIGAESALTHPAIPDLQGTITGQVVDAQSGQPIASAQVYLEGMNIGGLTQQNGRYLIQNVPPGTHTLRVERIGYQVVSREVRVADEERVVHNFELDEEALALDEIVVTGTAGQARRREVGNSIAQFNVDPTVEAPSASVGELLQGQVTGASISVGAGTSGSAEDIRLRGNVSMSMGNQPLIYIDGVRAKSSPYAAATGSDDPISPLRDLNPSDIDRIEIVKGPAATTLYGTEAAAGVIQIFTKSGQDGDPVWNASVHQGFSYFRPFGANGVDHMYLAPVFRKGHRQRYEASVRGGATDQASYYVSGSYADNVGAVETDGEQRLQLRGNLQFRPHEDWMLEFNNSLSQTGLSHPRYGNTISGIMMTAIRGKDSYMGDREPETLHTLLQERNETAIDRYISGLTLNFTPGAAMTHRLTLGHDYSQFEVERQQPYCWRCPMGFTGDKGGVERISNQETVQSIDYVGTLGLDLTDGLNNNFSFGFQAIENDRETVQASGDDFPGPGNYTVSSAARREGAQRKIRTITGGFFVQDRIGLLDRYFLTLGLRVDGNSAFGEDLGLEPYPKASMSYIISDESFWPEGIVGQTKLRAAYGLAGRAPGAFDAVRTWNPVGWGFEQAAFIPQNLGNDELGPERTQELELGFDAAFLQDRVSADVTYYRQATSDALFTVRRSPTVGGWNPQLENVGEIANSGLEVGLDATVLDRESLIWQVGVGITTNKSEVVSLGGQPPFSVGENGWVIEGQPAPVIRGARIMNYWEKADPVISENEIYGPAFPTHIFNLSSSVTLPGGIRLSGRGEYKGGHYMNSYFEAGGLWRAIPHPKCYPAYRKVDPSWEPGPNGYNDAPEGTSPDLYAWERAQCFGMETTDLTIVPVDHFELRQLMLHVPVSRLLPTLTQWADRTDLTIAAQNVWFWRNKDRVWTGHPEMNETNSSQPTHDLVKGMDEAPPPQSFFTVSLRVTF